MKNRLEQIKRVAKDKLAAKRHKELLDALDIHNSVEKALSGRDIKVYPKEEVSIKNFPKQQKIPSIPPFPSEMDVTVKNFPEPAKFPEFKIPDKIDVKKPKWYKAVSLQPVLKKLTTLGLAVVKGFGETLKLYEKADRPLAVRLSTGKDFYNAEGGSGGGASVVTANIAPPTNIGNGQKTVALAGTAEVLAASTTCKSITIKALVGNSGDVYVGSSSVTSANGFVLAAGDTVSLDIDNLADIYLDTSSDGDGVSYIYVS